MPFFLSLVAILVGIVGYAGLARERRSWYALLLLAAILHLLTLLMRGH